MRLTTYVQCHSNLCTKYIVIYIINIYIHMVTLRLHLSYLKNTYCFPLHTSRATFHPCDPRTPRRFVLPPPFGPSASRTTSLHLAPTPTRPSPTAFLAPPSPPVPTAPQPHLGGHPRWNCTPSGGSGGQGERGGGMLEPQLLRSPLVSLFMLSLATSC